jgi:hypothetical protein
MQFTETSVINTVIYELITNRDGSQTFLGIYNVRSTQLILPHFTRSLIFSASLVLFFLLVTG